MCPCFCRRAASRRSARRRVLDTRVRPPGITANESPAAATYVLSTTALGSSPVRCHTGARRQLHVRLRDKRLGLGADAPPPVLVVSRALSRRPNTGSCRLRRKRRLDHQVVQMLQHVRQLRRLSAPPCRRPTEASTPRRAARGRAQAEKAGSRPSRSRRSRARWRATTLPARTASTRPATPRNESPRSSSGSQKLSSSRRKMTLTG